MGATRDTSRHLDIHKASDNHHRRSKKHFLLQNISISRKERVKETLHHEEDRKEKGLGLMSHIITAAIPLHKANCKLPSSHSKLYRDLSTPV